MDDRYIGWGDPEFVPYLEMKTKMELAAHRKSLQMIPQYNRRSLTPYLLMETEEAWFGDEIDCAILVSPDWPGIVITK